MNNSNIWQAPQGSFKFAVQSLKDQSFVSKSFAGKDAPVSKLLQARYETPY